MDLDCQEALKTIIKRRRDVRAEFTGDPLGEEELCRRDCKRRFFQLASSFSRT